MIKASPDIVIACDAPACDTPSPTREDLFAKGGLIGLGWQVAGQNRHYCPAHFSKDRK